MAKFQVNEDEVEFTTFHEQNASTLMANNSNKRNSSNLRQNERTCVNSYKGILMSSLGGALMTFSGILSQFIPLHPVQILFFRHFGNLVVILPFITLTKKRMYLGKKNLLLSALYGVISGVCILARIDSVQNLPISDATVMAFATPVLVAAFARCCIKDRCSFGLIASLLLTFAGLILVVNPATLFKGNRDWSYVMGTCSASIAVLFGAIRNIMLAAYLKVYDATVLAFHASFVASILAAISIFSLGKFKVPTLGQSWLLFLQLSFAIPMDLLLIKALHYEKPAIVSVVRSISTILTAFLSQVIIYRGAGIDVFSISGAVLVLAGAVVLSLKTYLLTLPENNRIRKFLRILTV